MKFTTTEASAIKAKHKVRRLWSQMKIDMAKALLKKIGAK